MYVIKSLNFAEALFNLVSLHGEMYFTHVLLCKDGTIVFVDFHNMQKGPVYYDLAMFAISLYGSTLFMPWSPVRLLPLIKAFLMGYFGKNLNHKLYKTFALAQLYIILKEIWNYMKALDSKESILKVKLPSVIKIKRLKKALKEAIIPQLT
jgi:hypothetical protein